MAVTARNAAAAAPVAGKRKKAKRLRLKFIKMGYKTMTISDLLDILEKDPEAARDIIITIETKSAGEEE